MTATKGNHAGRGVAATVGVLYIVATAAGLIGLGAFLDPALDAPDYLASLAANGTQVKAGVLLELVMAVAVTGIGVTVYPVLRKHSARLAVGYLSARILEPVIYIINAVSLLTLLTLSQNVSAAGAADAAGAETIGALLLAAADWAGHVVLDVAIFPPGAFILGLVLYRSRLVPRWIAGWGVVGAVAYWAAGLLVMFDQIAPLSTTHIVLQAPLGLQELAFALWLIVRGFGPVTTAAEPTRSVQGARA